MVIDLGTVLSVNGAATLASAYVLSGWHRLQGTKSITATLSAASPNPTNVTTTEFQFRVTNDTSDTTGIPLACQQHSTGGAVPEVSLTAVAGTTVKDAMITTLHEPWLYVAVAAKITGGAGAAGDTAVVGLSAIDGIGGSF